jgi:hypothetical protein
MKLNKKLIAVPAIALAAGLGLAACGSSAGNGGNSSSTPVTSNGETSARDQRCALLWRVVCVREVHKVRFYPLMAGTLIQDEPKASGFMQVLIMELVEQWAGKVHLHLALRRQADRHQVAEPFVVWPRVRPFGADYRPACSA